MFIYNDINSTKNTKIQTLLSTYTVQGTRCMFKLESKIVNRGRPEMNEYLIVETHSKDQQTKELDQCMYLLQVKST